MINMYVKPGALFVMVVEVRYWRSVLRILCSKETRLLL